MPGVLAMSHIGWVALICAWLAGAAATTAVLLAMVSRRPK